MIVPRRRTCAIHRARNAGAHRLGHRPLTIIDRKTAAFTYRDAAVRLTKEPARGGKTLVPVDVVVSVLTKRRRFAAK